MTAPGFFLELFFQAFLRFLKNFQSRYFCEKSMVMYKSYLNCCLQNKTYMLLYKAFNTIIK